MPMSIDDARQVQALVAYAMTIAPPVDADPASPAGAALSAAITLADRSAHVLADVGESPLVDSHQVGRTWVRRTLPQAVDSDLTEVTTLSINTDTPEALIPDERFRAALDKLLVESRPGLPPSPWIRQAIAEYYGDIKGPDLDAVYQTCREYLALAIQHQELCA